MSKMICKAEGDLRLVYGEVYVPGFPDSQGEFMTTEEVRKMAHRFAMVEKLGLVDVMHDNKSYAAHVVESFVARKGDPDFVEGAWVAAVFIEDVGLWDRVKKGELNGFSLEGLALRDTDPTEIGNLPTVVTCTTLKSDNSGHAHKIRLMFDDDGNITGGETDWVDGHRHLIKRGTITESGGDPAHAHKFDFLSQVLGD
jgi:hypothetical protein